MNELWNQVAARASVVLSDAQHREMDRYLDLLVEANATMNLTRITDRAQAEVLHIADSLTLLPFIPAGSLALADLGSGGGVPGIPLAIARPNVRVLLVESTKKKAAFLRKACREMELANVEVSDLRTEDLARTDERETFDIVTARGVAAIAWLVEWGVPLLKRGGSLLAMKGQRASEEIAAADRAIKSLHAGEPVVHPVELPGTDQRVIVEIKKLGRTDERYPRPPTLAKGKTL